MPHSFHVCSKHILLIYTTLVTSLFTYLRGVANESSTREVATFLKKAIDREYRKQDIYHDLWRDFYRRTSVFIFT